MPATGFKSMDYFSLTRHLCCVMTRTPTILWAVSCMEEQWIDNIFQPGRKDVSRQSLGHRAFSKMRFLDMITSAYAD